MPVYRVTDPTTGITAKLTGDSPPTEQELEEIFSNIGGSSNEPQRSNLLTDPIETLKRSGGEYFGGIADSIVHLPRTLKSVGQLASGAVQKVIPGEQGNEIYADSLGKFFADRYGDLDSIKRTALEDPVGFASDLSMFMTGGGSALSKAGQVSKVGELAQAGKTISNIGKAVDPLAIATKGAGTVIKSATEGKKIAPFAKGLDNSVIEASKRLNVDLPASAKTTNRIPPILEAAIAKGLFNKELISKVDNAKKAIADIGDDMVRKIGAADNLSQAGEAILKGTDKFRERFFSIKEALYEKADFTKRAKDIKVNPNESLTFVNEILKKKKSASKVLGSADDIKYFQSVKDKLAKRSILPKEVRKYEQTARTSVNVEDFISKNPGINETFLRDAYRKVNASQANANEIRSAVQELNKKIGNMNDLVATGNKAELRKLATLLQNDLDLAVTKFDPKLSQDIQRANRYFKLSLDELNSHFGKQILRFKDQPDKILPAILKNSTSIDDVKRIYRMIGNENVKSVQATFLKDFLKGAKNESTGLFTPQGLSKQMEKFGDEKLIKILNESQVKKLKDIREVARGIGKFDKIAEGSQTAFTLRLIGEFSPLFQGDLMRTGLFLLGDAGFSKFISSPRGQAFLTNGVDLTNFGRKTGGRLINRASDVRKIGQGARIGSILQEE